jgi:hypothetical protein
MSCAVASSEVLKHDAIHRRCLVWSPTEQFLFNVGLIPYASQEHRVSLTRTRRYSNLNASGVCVAARGTVHFDRRWQQRCGCQCGRGGRRVPWTARECATGSKGSTGRDCGSRKCSPSFISSQWKSVSVDVPPHGVEPPYRPTECRARPYSADGPVNWLGSVLTSRVTGIVRREGYPCASMAK